MKNLKRKAIIFSLAIGLLLSFFLTLQIQAASQAASQKININTASVDELQKLPRIGDSVAQRIVDFRKKNGPFQKIEEIMKVKGIGEKTFEQIKDKITVGNKAKSK